jgi:hypothetical protein
MLYIALRLIGQGVMLASAVALAAQTEGRVPADNSIELLQQCVGQVPRKCCKWGRRWGCDPQNFGQTGCVGLSQYPNCWGLPSRVMACTSATCQDAGTEDVCNMQVRLVGMNVCKATGKWTTVGCGPNQWQCQILMTHRYDSPTAPKIQAFVCDVPGVTLCPINYSKCD